MTEPAGRLKARVDLVDHEIYFDEDEMRFIDAPDAVLQWKSVPDRKTRRCRAHA